jgi:hypothetical protein
MLRESKVILVTTRESGFGIEGGHFPCGFIEDVSLGEVEEPDVFIVLLLDGPELGCPVCVLILQKGGNGLVDGPPRFRLGGVVWMDADLSANPEGVPWTRKVRVFPFSMLAALPRDLRISHQEGAGL